MWSHPQLWPMIAYGDHYKTRNPVALKVGLFWVQIGLGRGAEDEDGLDWLKKVKPM